jgi:hypothetical protein
VKELHNFGEEALESDKFEYRGEKNVVLYTENHA